MAISNPRRCQLASWSCVGDATVADGGVFGVPTFALDRHLFWGNDRIPHLLATVRGAGPTRG